MNFKPILFSTPMVQAILEGRKTQTRRTIKPQPTIMSDNNHFNFDKEYYLTREELIAKSKIQKGDVLWVRETWFPTRFDYKNCLQYGYSRKHVIKYKADGNYDPNTDCVGRSWKPSIHMPKIACRIFLKVTDVRVESLQDISEDAIVSEGIFIDENDLPALRSKWTPELVMSRALKKEWKSLWHSINGKESWDANPWVWVYEFEQIDKPENFS